MFSKLSILSLIFVAAASVNALSYEDYLMERELSSDLLDIREPFDYVDTRNFEDYEARAFAEIREALEMMTVDAREPAPVPNDEHHKNHRHKHAAKKHNHKHNHKTQKVIVEKVIVEKPEHKHSHKHEHKHTNGKIVLVKEAPATKTVTVNGAVQTVVHQVGGPTITLAPQGTVTVVQGHTYTIAKPKATPINVKVNLKTLGKAKNDAQAATVASSMKLYALLGALTAVGALFA
jgi:hypothetical protein